MLSPSLNPTELAMDVAFGTLPEWVAAIGTGGALVAAVLLLRDDRKTRRTQDDLMTQEQAERIGSWITAPNSDFIVHVRNASDLPIYNVTVEGGTPAGHDPWRSNTSWITLPPGETDMARVPSGSSPTGAIILYQTTFTDSAGRSWSRDASGSLRRIGDLDYVGCS